MSTNEKVIIEVQCFPSICYFKTINKYQKVAFEIHENFAKQSFRNRFEILGPNGIQVLNIPLVKYGNNTSYSEIEINYNEDWQKNILKALKTSYASSPYYEYYIHYFEEIINSNEQYLLQFNVKTIELLKNLLFHNWEMGFTNSFEKVYTKGVDKRDLVKKRKNNEDWECVNKAYWQVFGNKFVPNLSVIDLIFCEGPLSTNYI